MERLEINNKCMIKKFSVRNFKNFKDDIIIDFSHTRDYSFNNELIVDGIINKAMILGKNSSGKSNLGTAIMDITTHLTDNKWDNTFYLAYLCGDSLENYASFKYEMVFNDDNVKYYYQKDFQRRLVYEELRINDELRFAYNYLTGQFENSIDEGKTVDISKYNNIGISVLKFIYNNTLYWSENNPFRLFMEFVNHMLWFRSLRGNEFMGLMPNGEDLNDFIVNNGLLSEFESFLKGLDQNYKLCITNGPLGKKVIGVEYKRFSVDFYCVASTGTLTLWLLFYWLHRAEKSISFMYIDEFDAFYNYSLSSKVLQILKESKYQTIVTSHNMKVVSNDILRPDCYLLLKNGKIVSLADTVNTTIRKANNLEKIMIENNLAM